MSVVFVAICAVLVGLMVTANDISKESHVSKTNNTKLVGLNGKPVLFFIYIY